MDLYDFYKTVVDATAQDSNLNAWAVANFGSPMNVHAGMPSDSFPDMDEDTPFLMFSEPSRSCSQNRRTIEYGFGAWLGLSNDTERVGKPDNETHPSGIELVLDGMRLVRLAVIAALPEGVTLDDFEEHADVNAVVDEVHGDMGFAFSQELTIGQDPMA